MKLGEYWEGGWEGSRNWLLGLESIGLAKNKPEEMGSLLCAFTVACCCCCCWELTGRRHVFKWHQSALLLSVLAEEGRGQRDRPLLICETERKTFCLTYKNTGRHSASRRTQAGAAGRNEVKLYRRTMESRVGVLAISLIQFHFLLLRLTFVFVFFLFKIPLGQYETILSKQ